MTAELTAVVGHDIDRTQELVTAALAEEGFGVLTEIDVAATLAAKLGIERTPYRILGACNPHLAHRALDHDPEIGLLLPCNVVLRHDEAGTRVSAVDPIELLGADADAGGSMSELAVDARARLERAIAATAAA